MFIITLMTSVALTAIFFAPAPNRHYSLGSRLANHARGRHLEAMLGIGPFGAGWRGGRREIFFFCAAELTLNDVQLLALVASAGLCRPPPGERPCWAWRWWPCGYFPTSRLNWRPAAHLPRSALQDSPARDFSALLQCRSIHVLEPCSCSASSDDLPGLLLGLAVFVDFFSCWKAVPDPSSTSRLTWWCLLRTSTLTVRAHRARAGEFQSPTATCGAR
jgi:hypothetical protein